MRGEIGKKPVEQERGSFFLMLGGELKERDRKNTQRKSTNMREETCVLG